jgi:hypothetical protein
MEEKREKTQKNAKKRIKIEKQLITYECIHCNFITNNKYDYNRHLSTIKHLEKCKIEQKNKTEINQIMILTDKKREKTQKNAKKRIKIEKQLISYECIDCNFMTNNKYDYNRHLSTIKHLEKSKIEEKNKFEMNENLTEKLIKTLIEQNKLVLNEVKESQEKMIEQNKLVLNEVKEIAKDGKIINNNTINNNNATFNLNFFLNETCKDAISIEDCINSIEITDDKFYLFGEKKLIPALSKIINYSIDKLSEIKRPVHCLDQKRDEYAIKLKDGWTRDETEYTPVVNKSISHLKDKYMNYGCGTIQHKVQESDSKIIKYTKCMIELTQKVQIKDFLKTAFNEKIINKKNHLKMK